MDMTPTKQERIIRRRCAPNPKLVLTLDVEMEDDMCEVIFGIPKEKGI